MKNLYITLLFMVAVAFTGCYDREIIESKPGESIDPVSNLNYNINEPDVVFTWDMPASYPSDVVQPVSVVVTVYRNNVKVSTLTLPDAPTTFTYSSYSSANTYRFIFKVRAEFNTEDPNTSPLRYSSGKVAVL